MPKKKATRASNRRAGLNPGEYLRRSTVYVKRVLLGEARYETDDLTTEDTYTLRTFWRDGFTHTVEIDGQTWKLPGKVVERLISQRDAVDKERKADRSVAQSARMKGTRPAFLQDADAEDAVAEAERIANLGGQ